jgi:hypothetical protein
MLLKKVLKIKSLQRIGGDSLAIVIPSTWIKEMLWDRTTKLIVAWRPDAQMIVIKKKENEEVSEPLNE